MLPNPPHQSNASGSAVSRGQTPDYFGSTGCRPGRPRDAEAAEYLAAALAAGRPRGGRPRQRIRRGRRDRAGGRRGAWIADAIPAPDLRFLVACSSRPHFRCVARAGGSRTGSQSKRKHEANRRRDGAGAGGSFGGGGSRRRGREPSDAKRRRGTGGSRLSIRQRRRRLVECTCTRVCWPTLARILAWSR